jgi:hypothetical protein
MSGKQHALREFLSAYPNEPRGIRREGDLVTFQVFIPEDLLPKAAKFANVERLYNATEVGIARQSQVGKGNRFKKGEIPHGIGLGG